MVAVHQTGKLFAVVVVVVAAVAVGFVVRMQRWMPVSAGTWVQR